MTSKEALEKLSYIPIYEEDERNVITDIDSCCAYKGDLCEVYGSEVDTIKKDLDRLEKLEKENQELKEKCKILEENEESILTTLKISVQENDKLEKVIEILKDELDISFEDTSQEGNGYWVVLQNWSGEEEVVINFNTLDNYDLLKEVLGDD